MTQTNVKFLGTAPAIAMGNMNQATEDALAAQSESSPFVEPGDSTTSPVDATTLSPHERRLLFG